MNLVGDGKNMARLGEGCLLSNDFQEADYFHKYGFWAQSSRNAGEEAKNNKGVWEKRSKVLGGLLSQRGEVMSSGTKNWEGPKHEK